MPRKKMSMPTLSTRGEIEAHKCDDEQCQAGRAAWLALKQPGIADYPIVRDTACAVLAYRIPRR